MLLVLIGCLWGPLKWLSRISKVFLRRNPFIPSQQILLKPPNPSLTSLPSSLAPPRASPSQKAVSPSLSPPWTPPTRSPPPPSTTTSSSPSNSNPPKGTSSSSLPTPLPYPGLHPSPPSPQPPLEEPLPHKAE
uniref:Uncharacterized protein n=1 Tax=Arcella intermedia TaxID=1963864 RepID=A0A6B2LQM1_9EUKA